MSTLPLTFSELEFLKEVHVSLKDSAANGKLRYPECAALDIVKTALRSFHNRKVIDLYLDETVRKCGITRTYRRKDRMDKFVRKLETYSNP